MEEIKPNINLEIVSEDKFKHINISFKFLMNYKKEDVLCDYALGEIIGEYSKEYPTKLLMANKKDELFGLSVASSQDIIGNQKVFNINYHFLNPFYAHNDLKDYLEFIKETLLNPYFSDEILDEIKYNYKLKIARYLDKPQRYASNQLIKIIGKENHLINKDIDNRPYLDTLKLDYVSKCYERMLNSATLYIYVIGDVNKDIIYSYMKDIFGNHNAKITYNPIKLSLDNYEDIIEEKNISQSYLKIVYETSYNNQNDDYFKWMIADALLGVVPNSLLFKEVREKRSLCYMIGSNILKPEGLSIISSPISFSNYQEVVRLSDMCIEMLIDKKYDMSELVTAKKILINNLLANNDDVRSIIGLIHSNIINHKNYTIDQMIKLINDVSMDDISKVMKTYKRRLVYVLRGTMDGKN